MAIAHVVTLGFGNFSEAEAEPPEAPTIAVADNEDGTGVTVTITNGNAGATHTVYRSYTKGELVSGTWTASGSRVGNGTVAVAHTTLGYYFWYVLAELNDLTSVSNIAYQLISSGEDSVRKQCRDAVVAQLQLLTLDTLPSDRIVGLPAYSEQVTSFPAVIVTYQETPDQDLGLTNAQDDWGYGIQVFFLDSSGLGPDGPDGKYTLWREQASRALHNQKLSGVVENYVCRVEPATILEKDLPKYNRVVSAFTVRCVTREPRGLGA